MTAQIRRKSMYNMLIQRAKRYGQEGLDRKDTDKDEEREEQTSATLLALAFVQAETRLRLDSGIHD